MPVPMLSVTFIRHGESIDNLKNIWAGWKDAPLSEHGMNQARALGTSLAETQFMHIYASDLKRASSTAEAVHDAQPAPQPPLTKSKLLREQHWGIAEGQPWDLNTIPGLSLEEHYKKGVFPVLDGRDERFPEGESLNDLRARADQAIREIVRPHILESARDGLKGVHIAIVSHGLCISELVPVLLDLSASPGEDRSKRYSGLRNTAWTRVVVDVKGSPSGQSLEINDTDLPPLEVKVTAVNQHEHLAKIIRQKGGTSAHDPKQSFFGGAAITAGQGSGDVEALDYARSNVDDRALEESTVQA